MKVPYAEKWQKETDKLRKIVVDCNLEALKWGKPCFTFQKKNVAIVIPLKESCAFSFSKARCLRNLYEAIALEESGKKVELKKLPEYLKREDAKNQISASRKVRADDPEWARTQRDASLRLDSSRMRPRPQPHYHDRHEMFTERMIAKALIKPGKGAGSLFGAALFVVFLRHGTKYALHDQMASAANRRRTCSARIGPALVV